MRAHGHDHNYYHPRQSPAVVVLLSALATRLAIPSPIVLMKDYIMSAKRRNGSLSYERS